MTLYPGALKIILPFELPYTFYRPLSLLDKTPLVSVFYMSKETGMSTHVADSNLRNVCGTSYLNSKLAHIEV